MRAWTAEFRRTPPVAVSVLWCAIMLSHGVYPGLAEHMRHRFAGPLRLLGIAPDEPGDGDGDDPYYDDPTAEDLMRELGMK